MTVFLFSEKYNTINKYTTENINTKVSSILPQNKREKHIKDKLEKHNPI